ncbi:endogenous retrovirus group S71 member 1 Env polyprotein-like [Rousettus aegyptiacus]|uniref:endogenous retrovirus group S71 member 1 Env polyprotein-like n=1 Tax=Rousettus aegyptiacus TaxID=9407 RepID=UPI00168D75A7|nr:endogenous retrovirus group S71 member 1 Env polyprotein-like [Rousettus aegyptiacus]
MHIRHAQASRNIHQPRVWELIITKTGEVIAQNITSHSTPEIRVDLCRLAKDPLTIATAGHHLGLGSSVGGVFTGGGAYFGYMGGPGCGILSAEKSLLGIGLYICPRGHMRNTRRECEGQGQFSCANWGCETISTIDNYRKQNDNHIRLMRGPSPSTCSLGSCNPLVITIKTGSPGEQRYWRTRPTWGIRLYKIGYDSGLYFTIQVRDPPRKAHPIGPTDHF